MDYVVRVMLCVHGFGLSKQGLSYIKNPRNEVFESLLKNEGLLGPGLDIAVPFLGIAYLSIGFLNLLAGMAFGEKEANYILIGSGLVFHIGMATVRSTLCTKTYDLYKPGMIRKTNTMQYGIGMLCAVIGVINCF